VVRLCWDKIAEDEEGELGWSVPQKQGPRKRPFGCACLADRDPAVSFCLFREGAEGIHEDGKRNSTRPQLFSKRFRHRILTARSCTCSEWQSSMVVFPTNLEPTSAMKLLGAELITFACFDRQFVPLREGISVLVGSNNAGKTAILRALSTLHTMPVGQPKGGLPVNLSGYFRPGQPGALEIICALEEADAQYIHKPRVPRQTSEYQAWVLNTFSHGIARWQFGLTNNALFLQRCSLELPSPSGTQVLQLIAQDQSRAFVVQFFQFPDFSIAARANLTTQMANGGPVLVPGELSSSLESIGSVRLVNPHRVVYESQLMQTALELPSDAANLAQFLQTLNGRERDTFAAIEKFVTEVFPEFKYVNVVPRENNQVSIELTDAHTNRKIPLSNCGTGVEQILTLATFVLTTPKPGLILLDEPHSYLHPTAERALVDFLQEHSQHKYLISTHSAVLMNSVEPDRIVFVSPPGRTYEPSPERPKMSRVLFDLGYRNSDSLFYDRLLLVEGKSDKAIIPILLLADGEIPQSELNRTGFPILEGTGKGSTALQTSIMRYESLIHATGRGDQQRMYLFDADRKDDEKGVLKGTSNLSGEPIKAEFLTRLEIENYLLVPEAIASAIGEELELKGNPQKPSASEIKEMLKELFELQDANLYPQGKHPDRSPEVEIKGSRVLERIYQKFGLNYHKERSGSLLAKRITAKNQSAIMDLAAIVRPLFGKAAHA